ncbi:MAG: imidazole glycerol phosphate synthase subunit HisH [Sporomusaceae bacterium]|nr:imidazole glycerol phosphate synthase subunit HisH [Sporomusaceae bacterium]
MNVIIDYGIGNTGSILNMLKHIGASAMVSSDPDKITQADKLILPGVGAFDAAMNNLTVSGLIPVLNRAVLDDKKPVLGICLGMQILGTGSEEGKLPGLGWIDFYNVRFDFQDFAQQPKLPHMGWNLVTPCKDSPLLHTIDATWRYYFVHSYYAVCKDPGHKLLATNYGYDFTSAVQRCNIYGVQFHPEKSHRYGIQILKNFVEKC